MIVVRGSRRRETIRECRCGRCEVRTPFATNRCARADCNNLLQLLTARSSHRPIECTDSTRSLSRFRDDISHQCHSGQRTWGCPVGAYYCECATECAWTNRGYLSLN